MQTEFHAALWQQDEHLLQDIKASGKGEQLSRLNVYRNNVFSSLQTALGEIFPICKQLVGDDFFNAMAHQYARTFQPKSPVLSDYGDYFADFIRTFLPAQQLPYLADLCELEHRILQLTHAAEVPTFTLEDAQQRLQQVQNPESLLLTLSANCQLMHCQYAIGSLYVAHQQPNPDLSRLNVNHSECLLLSKDGLYGCCYLISPAEYAFLSALQNGVTLSQALPDDESFELGQTLARLMTWQVLRAIEES